MSMDATNRFDAIVIGSGITGGWAAKELTEKGMRVLMLERGKDTVHGDSYVGEHVPPWDEPYFGKKPRDLYAEEYEVQERCYAFSEMTRHFFNNDKDNPYIRDEEKPFDWIRGDQVGGRSLTWGRQVYRWSDLDFEANKKDGNGIDWPIRYADIKDWYSYVENYIGVTGQAENLPQLPDGEFQPAMEMTAPEKRFKRQVEKKYPHIRVTMGRAAILTEDKSYPWGDRAACHYCGPCHRGCSTGSYFSTLSTTLPAAEITGNLTVQANTLVDRLIHDEASGRVTGVSTINTQTGARDIVSAKLVFLCASTVGSTQILMNSKSARYPNGLGNDSGALGHYLMDHTYGLSAMGIMGHDLDKMWYGNRPNNLYIPRFRNVAGQDDDVNFVRGYGYQGAAMRLSWTMLGRMPGLGADFKDRLTKPGPWGIGFGGFGEALPHVDNRMELNPDQPDRFGMPQVSFNYDWTQNEKTMRTDMAQQAEKMLKAAGAVYVMTMDEMSVPGLGIHEMGTARMGHSPKESVLNKWNQVHDVPNLFVTDGSCMTSASCVNPSLTYMALTARAVDYAVKQVKAGAI